MGTDWVAKMKLDKVGLKTALSMLVAITHQCLPRRGRFSPRVIMFCNVFRLSFQTKFCVLSLALVSSGAWAQKPPDAGLILQETRPSREQAPIIAPAPIEALAAPRAAPPTTTSDVRVMVSKFEFSGNKALSNEALSAVVASWVGRALNFGELFQATEAVQDRYKQAGFFLAQVNIAPQKIKDGVIEISISEGRLAQVRLEGESLVSADVVYRYLDRLPIGEALRLPKLERQILLINELAGGQASLDLQAGSEPGNTDVVLVQKIEPLLNARVEANNHGAPATGVNRVGLNLISNGFFNLGERISLNGLSSTNGGLVSYGLRGDLPVGADGLLVTAAASRAQFSLGGVFAASQASGSADSLHLGVSYPLIRSRARSARFGVEVDQNKLVNPDTDVTRTPAPQPGDQTKAQSRTLSFVSSIDWLDEWLGASSNRVDVLLRTGQLDLDANATSSDILGTAGQFRKLTLSANRNQAINTDTSLLMQFTLQVASKNLDSSERLSLGGPNLIPGYAGGEASADSGKHVKLGLRWQVKPDVALTAFTDWASIELSRNPLPAGPTNQRVLADFGVSADWQINKASSLSALVAKPTRDGINPLDNGKARFWVSLGHAW